MRLLYPRDYGYHLGMKISKMNQRPYLMNVVKYSINHFRNDERRQFMIADLNRLNFIGFPALRELQLLGAGKWPWRESVIIHINKEFFSDIYSAVIERIGRILLMDW